MLPTLSNLAWKILVPLAAVLASLLIGLIFQRFIFSKLHKIAKRSEVRWDDVLIISLKGMIVLWFFIIGVAIALKTIYLPPDISALSNKLIVILLIFSVILFSGRVSVRFVNLYMDRITVVPATIFRNLIAIIIYLVGFMIILHHLGISITPIITALGIGGLAIALALQDTLSNLFSGFHILITRQIKPGDYVKLDTGEEGYVTDVTWRNTTIRALPNNLIIVPNSKLASAIVVNYYLPEKEMAVLVNVGVNYDSDLEKVEKVTIEVAKEVMKEIQGGVTEFEPFIRYHTFADFSINFTVILRAKEFVDQYPIKHEFIKRLHKRYKEEGIEIPFPIRTVHLQSKERARNDME
ncbi:MAG: mechanosensitive ion channel family protein [Acidobacteriota bacterium]